MSGITTMPRATRPAVQLRALIFAALLTCTATSISLADAGSLTVTITPPEAVAAGAKWRVGTGPWRSSGETEQIVAVGFQIVTFKHITGWTAPPNIGFTVTGPALLERTAMYCEPMSAAAWGACTNAECDIPAPNAGWTGVAAGGPFSLGLRAVTHGACCLADGACSVLSVSDCTSATGVFSGPDTTCEPSPCPPSYCLGDADCSGSVDFFDIDAFVARLGCPASDPVGCSTGCLWQNADVDEDGDVDFFDIDPFVATLGNICP